MSKTYTPNAIITSPKTRKYVYRCLSALMLAAVFYRLVTAEEAAMWVAIAAVFLGVGGLELAASNTPKVVLDPEEDPEIGLLEPDVAEDPTPGRHASDQDPI